MGAPYIYDISRLRVKLEKIVHLVGFTIEMYHDARSHEGHTLILHYHVYVTDPVLHTCNIACKITQFNHCLC